MHYPKIYKLAYIMEAIMTQFQLTTPFQKKKNTLQQIARTLRTAYIILLY